MPRFFLHLWFGEGAAGLAVDHEGDELPNEVAVRDHVLETARDLMGTRMGTVRNWLDCTFDVTDETGRRVLTLPFGEVLRQRDPAS